MTLKDKLASSTTQFTFDDFVRFDLGDISIWSGTKRLQVEDFMIGQGGKLPPKRAASFGSKKIMNPERLREFGSKKKAMERLLLENGVRWRSGVVVVPRSRLDAVAGELDKLKSEANALVDQFIADYDTAKEEWLADVAAEDPDFADVLRQNMLTADEVRGRIKFDWFVEGANLPQRYQAKFDDRVASLGTRALDEVAVEANKAYESLAAKTVKQLNRRSMGPIRRWRDKLDGMSMLDGGLRWIVDWLDNILGRVPAEGMIEDALYHEIVAAVLVLCDPEKVRKNAANASTGMGSLFSAAAPAATDDKAKPDFFDAEADDEDQPAATTPVVVVDDTLFADISFDGDPADAGPSAEQSPVSAPAASDDAQPAVADTTSPTPEADPTAPAAEPAQEPELEEAAEDSDADPAEEDEADPVPIDAQIDVPLPAAAGAAAVEESLFF